MLARTLLRRPLASIGVRSLCAGVKSPDVFDVTKENFAEMVMKNSRPVILDCHAEWRGPCKQLGPVLEAAVKNSAGGLVSRWAARRFGLTAMQRRASCRSVAQ